MFVVLGDIDLDVVHADEPGVEAELFFEGNCGFRFRQIGQIRGKREGGRVAGIAEGVWASPDEVNSRWTADASFSPSMGDDERAARRGEWQRALGRSRDWARD